MCCLQFVTYKLFEQDAHLKSIAPITEALDASI